MKKLSILIIGMFLCIFTSSLNAQSKTGFEYFKGKWDVTVDAPNGAAKMVVEFTKTGDSVTATLKGSDGKELYKVNRTEIKDERAVIYFTGSQGNEVDLALSKKDDNNVSGSVMGMFGASGERVK
jgi:hypothetical protein